MKRLNEAELETRISNFLDRKFAEFPDLNREKQVTSPDLVNIHHKTRQDRRLRVL